MSLETVSLILAAFVSGALGVASVMRNFKSTLCLAFAFLCAAVFAHDGLALFENHYGYSRRVDGFYELSCFLAGTGLLLFFGELLPKKRRIFRKAIYGHLLLLFTLVLCLFFLKEHGTRVTRFLADLTLLLPVLLTVKELRVASLHHPITRERLRFRYMFLGSVSALLLYTTFPLHVFYPSVPQLGILGRSLLMVIFFLSFIQRELMTIDEIVAKIALFGGVALVLSVIFTLLVMWVGDKPGLFFFNTIVASFVILILFDPIRNLVVRVTRRLFLRKTAALEKELQHLTKELLGSIEPTALLEKVSAFFKRVFHAEMCRVFCLDRDELSYLDVRNKGLINEENNAVPALHPFVEYMAFRKGRPFVLETIQSDRDSFYDAKPRRLCESAIDLMKTFHADLTVPCMHEGKVVGFCLIRTGERATLSNEQLRLFAQVGRQMALTLHNARIFASLRDRDKLATVGEMAAGLAHEIKNPLGAIKGAAELLQEDLPRNLNGKENSEYLQIIIDETQRLSSVVTDFLDYAKPRRFVAETACDPLKVIEHTVNLVSRNKKATIEIRSEEPSNLQMEVDPEMLKQVLLNLLLNAVQAVEEVSDPKIVVRIRSLQFTGLFSKKDSLPLFKVLEGWEPFRIPFVRPFVEIVIEDNGAGIREEDIPKIFSPFFTTKPKGSGLGLAICERLVQSMEGSIQVKRLEKGGTAFVLHLPFKKETKTHFDISQRTLVERPI